MLLTVRPQSRGDAAAAAVSAVGGEDAAADGGRQEGAAGSPPDSLDDFAKGGLPMTLQSAALLCGLLCSEG